MGQCAGKKVEEHGEGAPMEPDVRPRALALQAAARQHPHRQTDTRPAKPPSSGTAGSAMEADGGCAVKRRCAAFLDSLGLDPVFFDPQYDRCYCNECVVAGCIPDILESNSSHGFAYEVPKGWCGFGLKVPPRAMAKTNNCFEEWAVSYHGCPKDVVPSVLNHGGLIMPGDSLMDGTPLGNRCTGGEEDRIGIYTSPSIKYSELDIYTQPALWEGYEVRIVFQCRQDMKTKFPALRIEGETIGWEYRFGTIPISRHFANSEIERYTNARASIIPYRILVGIDVITRWAEEENKAAGREAKQKQERRDADLAQALQQKWEEEDRFLMARQREQAARREAGKARQKEGRKDVDFVEAHPQRLEEGRCRMARQGKQAAGREAGNANQEQERKEVDAQRQRLEHHFPGMQAARAVDLARALPKRMEEQHFLIGRHGVKVAGREAGNAKQRQARKEVDLAVPCLRALPKKKEKEDLVLMAEAVDYDAADGVAEQDYTRRLAQLDELQQVVLGRRRRHEKRQEGRQEAADAADAASMMVMPQWHVLDRPIQQRNKSAQQSPGGGAGRREKESLKSLLVLANKNTPGKDQGTILQQADHGLVVKKLVDFFENAGAAQAQHCRSATFGSDSDSESKARPRSPRRRPLQGRRTLLPDG